MAGHIFQSESGLHNLPEAARRASPSFSVSERLARYGSAALSSREHLALLVGDSSLAEALLRRFGSIKALRRATCAELREFVSERQAEAVVAALSLLMIAEMEDARSKPITHGAAVYKLCQDMRQLHQEVLRVILLDTSYQCIATVDVTKGTLNETAAHPREILRPAIIYAAYEFVLAHTHPSGDPEPSDADLRATRRIAKCARLLEIELVDHVIVGEPGGGCSGYFSFQEQGLL
jgi:DNA repair protein RadC